MNVRWSADPQMDRPASPAETGAASEMRIVRNLHEVFGERDSVRRTTTIEAIFDRDCVFSDPRGRRVGHRELEDAVVALQD